jgi:hypothetical protein
MSFQIGNTISLLWKKLQRGDYTVKPFPVYKKWKVTTDSGSSEYFDSNGVGVFQIRYPNNHLYHGGVASVGSDDYIPSTFNSVDSHLLWYDIDHRFCDDYRDDKDTLVVTDFSRNTHLDVSGSLIVIPRKMFGEGIRKGSVSIVCTNPTSSFSYTLIDDSNGNLVDVNWDWSNVAGDNGLVFYVGFNEKYREKGIKNKPIDYCLDSSPFNEKIPFREPRRVEYVDGIWVTDSTGSFSGTAAKINNTMMLVDSATLNPTMRTNYAISMWINMPTSQSLSNVSLVNKNREREIILKNNKTSVVFTSIDSSSISKVYPFDISFNGHLSPTPSSITFGVSDGQFTSSLNSNQISSSWNHVVCQKSGSVFELWVNGNKHASSSVASMANISNDYRILVGDSVFDGTIDEIRFYNRFLGSGEIQKLSSNDMEYGYAYQTDRVGSVMYKQGMMFVSDMRPKYAYSLMGKNASGEYDSQHRVDVEFRGTTTFYEHEVVCKMRKNEFNFTQNPSIRKDKNENSRFVEDYATGSFFNPYFTTIGLYNDQYELLAIAKLASPIEKRDDVDMNVIIRWDS